MCDCNKNYVDSNTDTVVYNHNECRGITIDLLQMYLRPVQCCLNNSIFDKVQCTKDELETTQSYLESYISAKQADPETCHYKAELSTYQIIVQRIIIAGICI